MKRTNLLIKALAMTALLAFAACNNSGKTDRAAGPDNPELADDTARTQMAALSQDELVKKGKHLVMSIGCDDCHTPKNYKDGMPEPDMSLHMSGHQANAKLPPYDMATVKAGWTLGNEHFTAWVGPWGTSFSSNITPDNETGIGKWTEENFFAAIREGKYHGLKDSRELLPPMPWPSYRNLTDEELRAMFAYLKSIKPIKNAVPAPLPPKGASPGKS